MANKIRVSLSRANVASSLRDVILHSLESRGNVEIIEDDNRFADIHIVSAQSDEADVVARDFFRQASGGRLIVLASDGRSALLFATETTRQLLDEISADELAVAIEVLAASESSP